MISLRTAPTDDLATQMRKYRAYVRREQFAEFAEERARVRDEDPDRWPYGYSGPVDQGGECLECGSTNGGHVRGCGAVD